MHELATSNLPLCSFDCTVELPPLRHRHDLLHGDAAVFRGEFIDDVADSSGIDPDSLLIRQQPGIPDAADDVRYILDIITRAFDDGDIPFSLEILQLADDVLAALQRNLVSPGVSPMKPSPGVALSANQRETK
ncbi:hypothetical protein D3C78_1418850 [compost metagenome]